MTILAILLLLVVGAIAFLNMQMITLHLYFMSVSSPLWLIIVAALLVGMLIAILFAGAQSTASRKNIRAKEDELQEKLTQKDAELQAAKQETQDVAERTRNEMERDLQMKQKDEEIKGLQRHLDLMEEKIRMKNNTTHTNQTDDVVIIPDHSSATIADKSIEEDTYPNHPLGEAETITNANHASGKQDVDPTNRV